MQRGAQSRTGQYTSQQLLEPDLDLRARDRELTEIAKSIGTLAELFKDLSALVIDQGTLLDSVEYNIEQTATHVSEAAKELEVATRYVPLLPRSRDTRTRTYTAPLLPLAPSFAFFFPTLPHSHRAIPHAAIPQSRPRARVHSHLAHRISILISLGTLPFRPPPSHLFPRACPPFPSPSPLHGSQVPEEHGQAEMHLPPPAHHLRPRCRPHLQAPQPRRRRSSHRFSRTHAGALGSALPIIILRAAAAPGPARPSESTPELYPRREP